MMDVCAGGGADQLARDWITGDQILSAGMSAKLEFSCPRLLHGVEVRLLTDGGFSAGITSVEINGEPAESGSEALCVSISDLPEPRVENSVRKGRNLYESYQCGIALFSNLGTRITADPDFHHARALAGNRTVVDDLKPANIFLLSSETVSTPSSYILITCSVNLSKKHCGRERYGAHWAVAGHWLFPCPRRIATKE